MMWVGHASHAQKKRRKNSNNNSSDFNQEGAGFDCTSAGINMLPISRGRCKLFSCKCEAIFYLRQHLFSLESLSRVLAGPAGSLTRKWRFVGASAELDRWGLELSRGSLNWCFLEAIQKGFVSYRLSVFLLFLLSGFVLPLEENESDWTEQSSRRGCNYISDAVKVIHYLYFWEAQKVRSSALSAAFTCCSDKQVQGLWKPATGVITS